VNEAVEDFRRLAAEYCPLATVHDFYW